VLGQPHSNTLEELIRECQKFKDALDNFDSWNSGKNVTNSSKELDFVMDPFEPSEGWQEQDPEDWKPKHEYGGNRIPIRLQVLSVCHLRTRIHVINRIPILLQVLSVCHMRRGINVVNQFFASSSFRLHARASSSNLTCWVFLMCS
jgi:hypothetical protein